MKTLHQSWRVRPSARIMAGAALAAALATPAAAQEAAPTAAQGAPQAREAPVTLPAITVTGSGYETEASGSYTTDLISVGEKDARTQREVPQSTTVLTREYLDDRDVTSLDTAMRETPGIVVLTNDNGRSSIFSRGFEFDTLYFNGLPAPLSSIYGTQPDMAIVDHVEVLKGPAGLFGGAGEPAGAVNMRLKQALATPQTEITASGSTWGDLRAVGDVTGALTEDGALRGRLVLGRDQTKGWVDNNDNDTNIAFGTIAADLTDLTTLTFSANHMTRDIEPNNGLPTYADGTLIDVDRSTGTGADWNTFENTVQDYIGELEHHFDDGGHAKLSARYSDRDVDFHYAYAGSAAAADGSIANVAWLARDYEETSLALDAHVSRPFVLFDQEHNILAGVDYQTIDSTMLQGRGNTGDTNNIFAWNSALNQPTVTFTSQTGIETKQYGAYGQLRVKPVDPLTLIGGLRGTWYDTDSTNLLTGVVSSQSIDAEITPYAGVVYDVSDALSAYASYTQIFQPQSQVDANGNPLDPREGGQYEVGLKGNPLPGLNASAAIFHLTDANRSMADGNGNNVASEEVRVRGFDAEVTGTVAPGWEVVAGYTYSLTDYVNGPSSGAAFSTWTPKHMAQVWAKHRFADWSDVFVAGGVRAFSDFHANNRGTIIDADGYAVVDMMAGYDVTEAVTTTLTINNLFDKTYYTRVGGTSVFNFYGEPRSAVLEVKATF